jgi:hypothetical protein
VSRLRGDGLEEGVMEGAEVVSALSPTASTIAMNVFRVNPSTSSGRVSSA